MSPALPNPSSRLLRAAMAEQADLARHRERLTAERARLLSELREIDEALAAADRRLEMLAELAGRSAASGEAAETVNTHPAAPAPEHPADQDTRTVLRGPAIREAAIRVLVTQPERIDALHYRQWYELVADAGFRIAGKDPLAVFLTQLTRSPLVRKAATPGVYEVDRQAPQRIRQRLERLQAELREVTVAAHSPVELGAVRARRHELDLAISQQERALEEALRVLRADPGQAGSASAAHAG